MTNREKDRHYMRLSKEQLFVFLVK